MPVADDRPPDEGQRPGGSDGAESWVDERLEEHGFRREAKPEVVHTTAWTRVARVATDAGVVWFKASGPEVAAEGSILVVLREVAPELLPEVIAHDAKHGWLLTRDGGMRLREYAPDEIQLAVWERLLPAYAELQQGATPLVSVLLAAGVPSFESAGLVDSTRQVLDEVGRSDGAADPAYADLLRSGLGLLERLVSRLAAAGIPDSIQHDDLHDGNVLVDASERDVSPRLTVFDWGDACIAHPFHTLVVTLRSLAYRLGLEPDASELLRLRDAYLEAWTSYGSRAALVDAADAARRTGTLQRALAWRRLLAATQPDHAQQEDDPVAAGIRGFLADRPWGAWT